MSAPQLLDALNVELNDLPECAAMRLGARNLAALKDANAGNWCESSLIVRVHGTVGPRAFKLLRAILADARARYTLVE